MTEERARQILAMSADRLPYDTELAGIKQPPQASQDSQEWARRILPVLDGSKLQTMRKRVAAALDEQREHCAKACEAVADRLDQLAKEHQRETYCSLQDAANGARDCAAAIRAQGGRS